MLKRLLVLVCLLMPALAYGQGNAYQPQLLTFNGQPFGVCDVYQVAANVQTGDWFSCDPKTRAWVKLGLGVTTVANLPSAAASLNQMFLVTDGTSAGDCVTGGSTSRALCISNGATWNPVGSGGSGGGGAPTAPVNSIQKTVTPGTTFGPSSMTDDGTKVKFSIDSQFCGPSPYYDVRCYGATSQPSASTTATINSSSTSATLGAAQTFANGQGIDIIGAGPATSLSTPAAPTVNPFIASGPIMTGAVVAQAGAATCHYQVVAVDQLRGRTAASAQTTSTTCPNTFGSNSVGISSWSQTNNTVTIVLASAKTLPQFAMLTITGDSQISGQYQIASVIDTTHITITVGTDTRNGAQASGGNAGTITWYAGMTMVLPTTSNLWMYLIYSDAGGRGSMQLIGATLPQGGSTSDPLYNEFEDYGPTYTIAPSWSTSWAPTTPPGSAKAQDLITTITAGGGTTSVTLANAATTSVVGATFQADQAPNFAAAAAAIANTETGVLYIPPTSGNSCFALNEVLAIGIFGSPLSVLQAGTICARDTIQFNQAVIWKGQPQVPVSSGSFSFQAYPRITGQNASPVIWDVPNSSSSHFSYVTIDNGSQSDSTLFLEEASVAGIPATSWDHINFNSSTTDHTGRQLVVRNLITGGGDNFLDWVTFAPSQSGNTTAPAFIHTKTGASYYMTHMFTTHRGFYFGCGGNIRLDWMHNQGNTTPLFWLQGNCGSTQSTVYASNITFDTTFEPVVNYTSGVSGEVVLETPINFPVSYPIVVGPGTMAISNSGANLAPNSYGGVNTQQLTGLETHPTTGGVDGVGAGVGSSAPTKLLNSDFGLGANYQGFVKAPQVQTAPTCSISAGGTVPVSAHVFTIAPVFFGNGEGDLSVPSVSCSTSSGNQTTTINWTTVTGAIGYDIYDNGGSIGCSAPFVSGGSTTSYVWTGTPGKCGPSSSQTGSSGPTSWSASHVASPTIQGTNGIFNSITNPSAAPWIWTGPSGSCGTPPAVTSTSGMSLCLGDTTTGGVDASFAGDAWKKILRTGDAPTTSQAAVNQNYYYLAKISAGGCPTGMTNCTAINADGAYITDGSTTSTAVVTCPNNDCNFTQADVGKAFWASTQGSTPAGIGNFTTFVCSTTTIASVQSATQATLTNACTATGTANVIFVWGHRDGALLHAIDGSNIGCGLNVSPPTGSIILIDQAVFITPQASTCNVPLGRTWGAFPPATMFFFTPDFNYATCTGNGGSFLGNTVCFGSGVGQINGTIFAGTGLTPASNSNCANASGKTLVATTPGNGSMQTVNMNGICPGETGIGVSLNSIDEYWLGGGAQYSMSKPCEVNAVGTVTQVLDCRQDTLGNGMTVENNSNVSDLDSWAMVGLSIAVGSTANTRGTHLFGNGTGGGVCAVAVNGTWNSYGDYVGVDAAGSTVAQVCGGGGNGSIQAMNTVFKSSSTGAAIQLGTAPFTFISGGGNTISGAVTGFTPGANLSGWDILQGVGTGVATSASTLGLYGLGNNTTTTLTSTTTNLGPVMGKAGTLFAVQCTAGVAGNQAADACTVLKNNAATSLTCSLNGVTWCLDGATGHQTAFAVGDIITVKVVSGTGTTLSGVKASVIAW